MKRTLKAVIFDMDGVIADTLELYYITEKRIADYLQIPFTHEDSEKYKGVERKKIIESMVERSAKKLSFLEKEELADQKNIHYQQLIQTLDEKAILPGMEQFIVDLKNNHMKMAVASSSSNVKIVLQKLGLIDYFDVIVDPSSLNKGKPDPEIFLKAATELGISPENCAAIEDGEAGMKAIKSTKMFSIGIGTNKTVKTADWHVVNTEEITFQELLIRFDREYLA
ncbi:beta-phosphoglucomutase [Neobacillus sp. LXY-4]|uniref:beta-phosphoglucomutase n=1 Tax=Neobacillus sp. LXY-4 TaxID=3379826 RepID=UPI003EE0C9F3